MMIMMMMMMCRRDIHNKYRFDENTKISDDALSLRAKFEHFCVKRATGNWRIMFFTKFEQIFTELNAVGKKLRAIFFLPNTSFSIWLRCAACQKSNAQFENILLLAVAECCCANEYATLRRCAKECVRARESGDDDVNAAV